MLLANFFERERIDSLKFLSYYASLFVKWATKIIMVFRTCEEHFKARKHLILKSVCMYVCLLVAFLWRGNYPSHAIEILYREMLNVLQNDSCIQKKKMMWLPLPGPSLEPPLYLFLTLYVLHIYSSRNIMNCELKRNIRCIIAFEILISRRYYFLTEFL